MDEVMIRLMTKYLLTVFPVSRIKYGRRFKRGVNVDGHSFLLPGSSVSLKVKIYDSLKKRETEQEAKSFDVCEYLLQMIKNR